MSNIVEKIGIGRLVAERIRWLDAKMVAAVFDKPPKQDACPVCGDTDLFDGEGTCQICQPM